VPAAAAAGIALSAGLAAAGRTRTPLAAIVAAYAVAGSTIASQRGSSRALTSLALALVHLAYGGGVIAGALRPGLVGTSIGSTRLR